MISVASRWETGNTGNTSVSTAVVTTGALPDAYRDIEAGAFFSCSMGIGIDDSVCCWGQNAEGQLGDGTLTSRSSPVAVLAGGPPLVTFAQEGEFVRGVARIVVDNSGDFTWSRTMGRAVMDRIPHLIHEDRWILPGVTTVWAESAYRLLREEVRHSGNCPHDGRRRARPGTECRVCGRAGRVHAGRLAGDDP